MTGAATGRLAELTIALSLASDLGTGQPLEHGPTLLLAGTESPAEVRKATDQAVRAIPGAQVRELDGHAHMAHKTDPAMVAGIIRAFDSS